MFGVAKMSFDETIMDGFPASKLFGQGVSYTYDDVIFLPGHINFSADQASGLRVAAGGSYFILRPAMSLLS